MSMPIKLNPAQFSMFAAKPSRSTGKSAGAKKAVSAGKEFELLVGASCIDRQGIVMVLEKIGNFARRIPDRVTGQSRLVEYKSPFDYAGVVDGTGRGVFFDCKSMSTASFGVHDPSLVKPHQIISLHRQEKAGAIAGFLIRAIRPALYLWLPASRAENRIKPIQWDDPAFVVLGQIQDGHPVPLRKLTELQ